MTNNGNNIYKQPQLQLPFPMITPLESEKEKHEENNKVEDFNGDVRKNFEVDFDINKEDSQ